LIDGTLITDTKNSIDRDLLSYCLLEQVF
jgi:hypothetical protein